MEIFRYIDTNFAKFILSFISSEDNISKKEKDIISLTAMIISYELSLNHVCFEISSNNKRFQFYLTEKDISIPTDEKVWVETLLKCKSVIGGVKDYKPIIFDEENNKVFLQKNFYYESFISDRIKEMCKAVSSEEKLSNRKELKSIFNKYEIKDSVDLDISIDKEEIQDFQTAAVYSALINNFTIISGGPGTGKTTVLARLLSVFIELNLSRGKEFKFALAAPTGKAAMRMNQSISESLDFFKDTMSDEVRDELVKTEATTIHRLLKYKYYDSKFTFNIDNKLDYDLVVIDEVSMIDLAMFYNVVSALKKDTKLVLIGDMNQLSSVEAGSVLADICLAMGVNDFDNDFVSGVNEFISDDRKKIANNPSLLESPDLFSSLDKENTFQNKVIQLKRSFRFRGDSGIGTISKMIIANEKTDKIISLMKDKKKYSDCLFFPISELANDLNLENILSSYNLVEKFRQLFNSKNQIEALENLNKFKILTTTNQGIFGVEEINKLTELLLEKNRIIDIPQQNKNHDTEKIYNFKPIMILSNDYNLKLYNGDTGIIYNGKAFFKSDNEIKEFFLTALPSYQTAYAFTIHKSQGSEFNEIFVVLPNDEISNSKLNLSKELIYTAITRAKEKCIIVGGEEVLRDALSSVEERNSGLVERFK